MLSYLQRHSLKYTIDQVLLYPGLVRYNPANNVFSIFEYLDENYSLN